MTNILQWASEIEIVWIIVFEFSSCEVIKILAKEV